MTILRNILLLLVAVIASTNATQIWVQYVGYALDISNSDVLPPNPFTGSVAACQAACTSNNNCNGFNYNTQTGVCTMTKADWDDGEHASDWTYAYGVTFYGTSYPVPQSGPTATALTCSKSASEYYDEETSRQFICPLNCASDNSNVYGTGQYRHSSSICRAAVHDGRISGTSSGTAAVTVYFVGPAPVLTGSTAHGVASQSRGYSSKTFTFATYTPPPPSCRDIHFWVPEGLKLEGNLQNPQVLNNNFDNRIYSGAPDVQAPALFGCPTTVTFSNVVKSTPFHHTVTDPGYTPIYGPFTLNPDGTFVYINIPSKTNNDVWNGYDSFTFQAQCGSAPACTQTAYINVVRTLAVQQNAAPTPFVPTNLYTQGVKCTGNCRSKGQDGMWLTRQTLPRIWDTQKDEAGNVVKPTLSSNFGGAPTDGLDFEWMSNYALISTYGAIGTMSVRFPTFEVVEWQPGQNFVPTDFDGTTRNPLRRVAFTSTGFNQNCLSSQGTNGKGSDVWSYNANQLDGHLATNVVTPLGTVGYNTGASWYQKFGGKHDDCNIFKGIDTACRFAPLLSPRLGESESQTGIWRLEINNCEYKWQGKFTWNAMRTQTLAGDAPAKKVWNIAGGSGGADYVLTSEIYNQAVQPNSWTEPARGFVEVDTKYLLKVVLASDTDFQFQMGIDIFTVDLQQFRFTNVFGSSSEQAFGYNMIVYPTRLNTLQQSAPDRRVIGYKWVEQKWIAPNAAQCTSCGTIGRVTALTETSNVCTSPESTDANAYTGPLAAGNCGRGDGVVFLFKGPQTTDSDCSNDDPMIVKNVAGISPAPGTGSTCKITYQNITLRGSAPGSSLTISETDGFGFEGRITLTFLLANGEHPHFVIEPKMYVKSISVNGAFSGSSSTCRGSPYWPVTNSLGTDLPAYICEEPDARTFGPTDWAAIFFDIKDVDANLVQLKSLYIAVNTINIRFYPTTDINGVTSSFYQPQYQYFNYRVIPSAQLVNPTAPTGVVPPKNTDFGFAFTPGAHNENMKITIYCTLSIKQTTTTKRRFASQQDGTPADNTMQERLSITQRTSTASSVASNNQQVSEQTSNTSSSASSSGSSVTVMVLAAACAVLLAAVIGLVLYVVRQNGNNAPKRVASTA